MLSLVAAGLVFTLGLQEGIQVELGVLIYTLNYPFGVRWCALRLRAGTGMMLIKPHRRL